MKSKYILIYALVCFFANCYSQGKDQVLEILDSLEHIYGYNSITYNSSNVKFKPGEIPSYTEDVYKDRVLKLNTYSPFTFSYNNVVQNYINRYVKKPTSVSYILSKSKYYFPLFEKYLNQFSIPLELKNLAIVESALNPTAKSQCGASGLWQFMYGTAKSYHLEINSLIDERYDPEKETIIACMYLRDLYNIYKDWPLVLAAYNCGPGNVDKAIKRSGKRDFWSIYEYLPHETQGYVPAFIAATYITTYYEEHNVNPSNSPYLFEELDYINIDNKTSFTQLSAQTGVDLKHLKYLNPKYFMGIIPGLHDKVYIPVSKTNSKIQPEYKEPVTSPAVLQVKAPSKRPEKKALPKKKSPFGTIYSLEEETAPTDNNSVNKTTVNEDENLIKQNESSKTFYCETYSDEIYQDQGTIKLRLNDNKVYPANSILTGKVYLLKNSAFIKIYSVQYQNKSIPISMEGEVYVVPSKGKISIESGYTVILKG